MHSFVCSYLPVPCTHGRTLPHTTCTPFTLCLHACTLHCSLFLVPPTLLGCHTRTRYYYLHTHAMPAATTTTTHHLLQLSSLLPFCTPAFTACLFLLLLWTLPSTTCLPATTLSHQFEWDNLPGCSPACLLPMQFLPPLYTHLGSTSCVLHILPCRFYTACLFYHHAP